ncbi:MAG: hypothetical protein AABX89_03895 [Candidatus Thermoplasmatota archaeon]
MDAQTPVRIFDPPLVGEVEVIGQKGDGQWQCLHPIYMGNSLLTLGYAEFELVESWTDPEGDDWLYYALHIGQGFPGRAVTLAGHRWRLKPGVDENLISGAVGEGGFWFRVEGLFWRVLIGLESSFTWLRRIHK